MQWVFVNGLGERDANCASETDTLTSIKFDQTGEFLAVGDKGGRVIIFRPVELKNSRYFDFRYFTEFQSHEPEFDHLKSIELHEAINSIAFVNNSGNCLRLLATNERIIKLWKIDQRTLTNTTGTKITNG